MSDSGSPNDFMKYSSLGIQLMVIILLFTFGGKWVDGKMQNAKPIFMALGAVLGVVLAVIYMIRETGRNQNGKK